MATRILVPYHLDEHLPALDVPLRPDRTVTARLPDGDLWARLAVRDEALAEAVRESERPVVLSGDCMSERACERAIEHCPVAELARRRARPNRACEVTA